MCDLEPFSEIRSQLIKGSLMAQWMNLLRKKNIFVNLMPVILHSYPMKNLEPYT